VLTKGDKPVAERVRLALCSIYQPGKRLRSTKMLLRIYFLLLPVTLVVAAGCVPMVIAENALNRGHTQPIISSEDRSIARDLEVYKTLNHNSFLPVKASISGDKMIVPYGAYFMTRLAIELKDKNIRALTLDNASLVCNDDSWITPKRQCTFRGKISFKIEDDSYVKYFEYQNIKIGPSSIQQSYTVEQLKYFLKEHIFEIAQGIPALTEK
tara:strand:- start:509 stop:1141 length:633 start_codon:yes stop_codon:yes gene_type:complete